jgi:hypothetical protein
MLFVLHETAASSGESPESLTEGLEEPRIRAQLLALRPLLTSLLTQCLGEHKAGIDFKVLDAYDWSATPPHETPKATQGELGRFGGLATRFSKTTRLSRAVRDILLSQN